jgi:RHH-type proline utilization regulon transcriptional repressor/proline dehydrogenase/delta 1-pyrroline-5-carboxylate dehydrogenase
MREAIRSVKAAMGGAVPLLIGDRPVHTAREIVSRNPARPGEVVGRVSSASREDADAAVADALRAFDRWGKTGPEERAGYLFRAAGEMRKRRFELAALEVIEVGKTWSDADGDVAEAIDYLEYYGREMVRLGGTRLPGGYPGEENEYRYAPLGIAAVIAPWNFPLAIATGMTAAAVVTGNCAIFKPSERSPVTGSRLYEVFHAAGLPAGVLQFLPGPGNEAGEHLVTHRDVDLIAFTGSKETGLRIVRTASETRPGQRNVKRVIAEMGGKNAIIVDETADLDEAVKEIVRSAFEYQGQKCSACSRVIAVGAVFDGLRDRLADAAASIAIGPTEDPANLLGPVIDEAALRKIRSYVELGRREGRAVLERDVPAEGWYAGPVIFVDVPPASRLAVEEIFGPVLLLLRATDIDEAVRMANESQYALTGGLFSRSPANISRVKESFDVGNLYINRRITGALVGRQPFGGFRMSGVGSKAGGPDYLLQFMHARSISENTIRRGFAPLVGNE